MRQQDLNRQQLERLQQRERVMQIEQQQRDMQKLLKTEQHKNILRIRQQERRRRLFG